MKRYIDLDDKALISFLKQDDQRAFSEIYSRYKKRLISALLRILKDPDIVEEILQDLFTKLWERRMNIDPEQSLNAYLFKIAHNLAYDIFRKAAKDKKLFEKLLLQIVPYYEHIEQNIFNKENRNLLHQAIKLLPPQQQKVIILCKLEDKSYEEVAKLLNLSIGTVNNHIHRANAFLKNHFSRKISLQVASGLLLEFLRSYHNEITNL